MRRSKFAGRGVGGGPPRTSRSSNLSCALLTSMSSGCIVCPAARSLVAQGVTEDMRRPLLRCNAAFAPHGELGIVTRLSTFVASSARSAKLTAEAEPQLCHFRVAGKTRVALV